MTRILALVPDLMLASRVQGSLGAAGYEVAVRPGVDAIPSDLAAEGFAGIVCDLEAIDPAVVAATGLPVLGFYSHVDVATRDRALEAGIGFVVPRSRMARELPKLVERLLGD